MKLADGAVAVSDRGSSHMYDGTVIEKDLSEKTVKWTEELMDMLRGIHTEKVLAETLQNMIRKIAKAQNTTEHLRAIDSILKVMRANKELKANEVRFVDYMLERVDEYREDLSDPDYDTVSVE